MKKNILFFLLLKSIICCSQIGIGNTNVAVDGSAALQINSTTKGLLVPKMTSTQRSAIASPANGLLVYDTTINQFYFYNGTAWVQSVGPAGNTGSSGVLNNYSIEYSAGATTPLPVAKGDWIFGPGTKTITLGNSVIVNLTVSAQLNSLAANQVSIYCSICYALSPITNPNPSVGEPIRDVGGSANIINTTLSNSVPRTVSLMGKVSVPSSGIYKVGPCFKSTEDLLIYGVLGYIILIN